ncbi:SMC-Scp complex subunit ScpB [Deferribacterales bacterium RsTz2092]|nr:segregation and condensation protein B [Deferribacterales bacterium]
MERDKNKKLFISALFLAGKSLEVQFFQKFINSPEIEADLATFADEFNVMNTGLEIRAVSGGYQLVSAPDVSDTLSKYFGARSDGLSRGALETLSVISYKQRSTKAEVDTIRGVDCSHTMRVLLEKGFIASAGRRNVAGKPLEYVTTKYFLEYFGLKSISELPTFREWQELHSQ